MGVPCSTNKKSKKGDLLTDPKFNTSSIYYADEKLKFQVRFTQIKARNIPGSTLYIAVDFAGIKQMNTSESYSNITDYTWKFDHSFEFTMKRSQLREKQLKMTLIDKTKKEIGTVNLTLYDIVTGPAHQDFVINMKKGFKEAGRLTFDVFMSQIINLTVRSLNINCNLHDILKEKLYNYSMKMNTKEREIVSDHSVNFRNKMVAPSFTDLKNFEEDENYQVSAMEEGKNLRTRYFNNAHYNDNYSRMQHGPDSSNSQIPDQSGGQLNNTKGLMKKDLELEKQQTGESIAKKRAKVLQDENNTENNSSFQGSERKAVRLKTLALKEPIENKKKQAVLLHDVETRQSKKKGESLPAWAGKRELKWEYEEHDVVPELDMEIDTKELANGSFQFLLWSSKEPADANESIRSEEQGDIYIDLKLQGECYIGINKFFFGGAEINFGETSMGNSFQELQDIKPIQKRAAKFEETLWQHGVPVGQLQAEFKVEHTSFYNQMICGVRTEDGVQKFGNLYIQKEKKALSFFKDDQIKEVKQLKNLNDSLKTAIFNLSDRKLNLKQRLKFENELHFALVEIKSLIKTSHKESMMSFLYKTSQNLLYAQKMFVELANNLLDFCDQAPVSSRPQFFENLNILLIRGEFELSAIGFAKNYGESGLSSMRIPQKGGESVNLGRFDPKFIQQKTKVCGQYQKFLYNGLRKGFEKLNQKGTSEEERAFVEQFIAIAYFRIPKFREKVLECIGFKNDERITEWRGTEWGLDEKILEENKNFQFLSLFDWENDFYKYLQETDKGESNESLLDNVLQDETWQNRFAKRGIAFFFFLEQWANHINKTVVIRESVPWQDLPGYPTLIKAFLIELKNKDVRKYPDALKAASHALLKNDKLINSYITVLYQKTKLYDSSSVFATYDMINAWFKTLRESGKNLPSAFDSTFFFKGVYMVLEGDHALNIAKVLWMIYNNFNIFSFSIKEKLIEFLLTRNFFRLFLHWSWNVRQIYHYLLLYRLYHQHRSTSTNVKEASDLKKELLLYNQKREHIKTHQKLLINDLVNMEYSRYMTIIENAYKKYKEDRKLEKYQRKHKNINLKAMNLLMQYSSQSVTDTYEVTTGNRPKASSMTFDGPGALGNDANPERSDSSVYILNADKIESSRADNGQKYSPLKQIAKSNSMEYNVQINPNVYNKSGRKSIPSLKDDDELDADKMKPELDKPIDDKSIELEIKDQANGEKPTKSAPKVIHRKFIYFDKKANRFNEIPKENMVYLEHAYNDFEKTKHSYLKWLNELQHDMLRMNEEETKKAKADPKVPELVVQIPLDDGEGAQIEPDEW